MLLDVAPLNVLNVSDFYAILSHRWSIVPLASRAACLVPASHGLPSSSPLRAFLSTYPALSPHFKEMLRALRRSSTPFSFLAAAFPFAICVLHFYTVLISCDALGGYASPSLSWPFFSSLSSVPSLFLPLSFSAFLCSNTSFSLYMVSLIYALQSPSNLPLSSFSATADLMLLRLASSTWSTSPSNCTCPSHLRPSGSSSGCPSWQARHSPCH